MKITIKNLTPEYIRSILHYEPILGVFIWKVTKNPRARAGDIAGTLNNGHVYIRIDGEVYTAESLACMYQHADPPKEVNVQRGLDTVKAYLESAKTKHNSQ